MPLSNSIAEFRSGVSQINAIIQKACDSDSSGNDIFDDSQKEFIISSEPIV